MDRRVSNKMMLRLSALAAEIMEDSNPVALTVEALRPEHDHALLRAGQDVAALAVAIEVIRRRAESE
jgi:hypothetical protein